MTTSLYSSILLSASLLSSITACTGDDAREPATERVSSRAGARPTDTASPQAQTANPAIKLGASVAQLETIAASRGDVALDVTVLSSEVLSPSVVTTVHASFAETVEYGADGIEQSWYFEQAPGATGDLTIVVGATGLDYVSTSTDGLLLRRTGELDVHYSHGTWLEANGSHTPIPVRFDHGRILLTVPASLVARSTYPAVLDPKIIVTPITS
jgi:hypothetical protein